MNTLRIAACAAVLGFGAVIEAMTAAGAGPAHDAEAPSPWVELHAARARLVASDAGAPDGVRVAGLEIVMADGWKTYWRTPGDSGVPPQFDWTGSTNAARIEVLYPAPKRMAEAGGEVLGYKDAVLLPIAVTPEDAAKPVTLKLALEFGICREICVPAVAALELSIPPPRRSAHPDAIKAALDRVPRLSVRRRPADPELRQVSVDDSDAGPRLAIVAAFHGSKGADVFVEAPEGLYVPLPRLVAQDGLGVTRFAAHLPGELARDLKGRTLTLTLVSEAGATQAEWKLP
ncbi:MAG TPA: protein-disulfide reductase DsbD domain-containing protein [Hyphomicrobiaceae bacterium]|jgi:DsbC/DsbD-like thiol-disulfide interchange protein|nr:protein-disulfide reductase DsbD domain-containing protein [Hyphomicrobiaceae bacterium]